MPRILPYPGVYDSTVSGSHIEDHANAIATKAEKKKFGEKDRSSEIIYSTTLDDGRTVCVYGTRLENFFRHNGNPTFTVQVVDKSKSTFETWTVPVDTWIRTTPNSLRATFMNLPQRVLDELDKMGREFYEANKERLLYRREVRDKVLNAAGLK